jgi:hypothetical protein
MIFIAIGVLILLVDIAAICVYFARGGSFWFALEVYIFLFLTLSTGVGCIVHGLRSIRNPDDVPSKDDGSKMAETKASSR